MMRDEDWGCSYIRSWGDIRILAFLFGFFVSFLLGKEMLWTSDTYLGGAVVLIYMQ